MRECLSLIRCTPPHCAPNPPLSPPPVLGCSKSTLSKTFTPTVCSPRRLQVGLTAGWQAPELFNVCTLFCQSPQVHLTSASSVQDTYDSGRHHVFAGHSARRQRKRSWFPGGLRQPKAWLVPVFKRSLTSSCDFPMFRLPLLLRYWTQHSPHWQHWTGRWLPVTLPQCGCLCGEGLTSAGNIHAKICWPEVCRTSPVTRLFLFLPITASSTELEACHIHCNVFQSVAL